MPNSQVTITLGRSGQRVVKESWGDSAGGLENGQFPGNKRSVPESDYVHGNNKRMRGEISSRGSGSNSGTLVHDSRLCPSDLRLKLRRKRASRLHDLDNAGYPRNVQHEKFSGRYKSLELHDNNLERREASSSMRITGPPVERSMASSYSSWPSSGVRARSPQNSQKYSPRMSEFRQTSNELSRFTMARQVEASRTERVPSNQPIEPYIPKAPIPSTPRLIRDHSLASRSMPRPSTVDNQTIALSDFLHSLGLEKYSINFQAEEIDMAALKQMRDTDLKELGIPMGPRKKILLTLQGPARRPPHSLHA